MQVDEAEADRRVRRSRQAVLNAFADMVLDRRYEDIRIGDILERANIGRTTFYAHFSGKEDVLVQCMDWVLDTLANAVTEPDRDRLCEALAHVWENRNRGRTILNGTPGACVERSLARRIEALLQEQSVARGFSDAPSLRLGANAVAATQMALLQSWIRGDASVTTGAMADMVGRSARALAGAMLAGATVHA